MKVEVCHATTDCATRIEIELGDGATVGDAIRASGIGERLDLALVSLRPAIFGRRVAACAALRDGDRVELLRALLVDPKEGRRRRALKKQRQSAGTPAGPAAD